MSSCTHKFERAHIRGHVVAVAVSPCSALTIIIHWLSLFAKREDQLGWLRRVPGATRSGTQQNVIGSQRSDSFCREKSGEEEEKSKENPTSAVGFLAPLGNGVSPLLVLCGGSSMIWSVPYPTDMIEKARRFTFCHRKWSRKTLYSELEANCDDGSTIPTARYNDGRRWRYAAAAWRSCSLVQCIMLTDSRSR